MVSEHFVPQVGEGVPACAMTGQGAERGVVHHSTGFLAFPLLICLTLGPQNQAIHVPDGSWALADSLSKDQF